MTLITQMRQAFIMHIIARGKTGYELFWGQMDPSTHFEECIYDLSVHLKKSKCDCCKQVFENLSIILVYLSDNLVWLHHKNWVKVVENIGLFLRKVWNNLIEQFKMKSSVELSPPVCRKFIPARKHSAKTRKVKAKNKLNGNSLMHVMTRRKKCWTSNALICFHHKQEPRSVHGSSLSLNGMSWLNKCVWHVPCTQRDNIATGGLQSTGLRLPGWECNGYTVDLFLILLHWHTILN